MKQERILELLKEAAVKSCPIKRRNSIQKELCEDFSFIMKDCGREDYADREHGRGAGMMLLFHDFYIEIINHHPELLPLAFPFFAMVCGDRKYMMTADVEWYLYLDYLAEQHRS